MNLLIKFPVDGEEKTIDLDETLRIQNAEVERDRVAALMAHWGALWGQALADAELAETAYRAWRGDALTRLLERDPKIAEWKAMAMLEASTDFRQLKAQIADAARITTTAKAMYEAYSRKAELLARLITRDNNDRFASGAIGRSAAESTPSIEDDPRVEKMRQINAAKRKGS